MWTLGSQTSLASKMTCRKIPADHIVARNPLFAIFFAIAPKCRSKRTCRIICMQNAANKQLLDCLCENFFP